MQEEKPPTAKSAISELVSWIACGQAVNEHWQEIYSEHRVDGFTALYLRPKDKCVPGWFIGDDIMEAIIELYHHPLAAVGDELADNKQIWPGAISVCVMPSSGSDTVSVVYARQRVLFGLSRMG